MTSILKIRTVFIGNRPNILRVLEAHTRISLVACYADDTSVIESSYGTPIIKYSPDKKSEVLKSLNNVMFDLLVSAGCPFKIPVSDFSNKKVFINSHPSALPKGRGQHPINESLISDHQTSGSTLHYISKTFDAGDIIYQETFKLTDDIDARLLYGFIFELEAEVFSKGLEKLLDHNLQYCGQPQTGTSTYYSRKTEDRFSNLKTDTSIEFLSKVRSFSSKSQGVITKLVNRSIVVFQAEKVTNRFLLKRYERNSPGTQLLNYYKEALLIRTRDGLVKISNWADLSE